MDINLRKYDNKGYNPGAGPVRRILWYLVNMVVFHSWLVPSSLAKCALLRFFGASIGKGVVIKPRVNIKYPWYLKIGDSVWIGEGVWIDNLTWVKVESNVCVSQGAYLLTGNHDYKDPYFGLVLGEVVIEKGAWIGARCVVCAGICVGRNSVLTVGSILQRDSLADGVYRGNPAEWVRKREIKDYNES